MLSRTKVVVGALLAGGALCLSAAPSQAIDGPSVAPFLDVPDTAPGAVGTGAIGACSFLASGPSLDPTSNPYHVVGTGTITSTKVVVSTSIRCRLRLANVSGNPQHGITLAQALPGNSSAVAGDINVTSFGPFLICTMVSGTYSDTTRYNPTEAEQCRPLTRI